ncbi:hypothetical protein [Devosia chinhatensis]|uniref:DUF945 domain-containing protein n=1 Tax=Devosia chinhatensis TaxID=429727 RepID=A0A0F5FGS9_9HYPH|nr:hypothetical protein [Devosia chinhatensis]KKB07417.1 hypothetical protein VE26_11640 [Devosia chinhatensis]
MLGKTKTKGLMLATGLATLAMMQPAMALDAEAFVNRIEAVYGAMGYQFDFGPATAEGTTITVDGVTVSFEGMSEEPFELDTTLTFTGVEEFEDGSFTAEELTIPDIDTEFASDPVGHISVTGMVLQDLWLPPEGDTSAEAMMQTVGRMASGPLVISRDGAEVIKIDSMEAVSDFTYAEDDSLESIVSSVSIANIWADLSTVGEEEPEAGAVIEALGLTNISGNISQSLTWTMADGRMTIDEGLMDFADIGALNITFDISGFTLDVLDKIYAMQSSDLDPESEEGQAEQMMMGMQLAQALSIVSANVRYDDAGLAPRLLDMFAAQSGVERAQFVESIKPAVPAMVGQAGIPQLTEMVVPAVNAFLDDPQSFEVNVAPPSPTSLLVLAAAGANPAGLITALGLTITANQ